MTVARPSRVGERDNKQGRAKKERCHGFSSVML
jgi:hypothetical protein